MIDQGGLGQIGLGIVERDLKLQRIEPVENLAGLDVLVVMDIDVRTMPDTSVEMPTFSAFTYASSVDMIRPPVTYQYPRRSARSAASANSPSAHERAGALRRTSQALSAVFGRAPARAGAVGASGGFLVQRRNGV